MSNFLRSVKRMKDRDAKVNGEYYKYEPILVFYKS